MNVCAAESSLRIVSVSPAGSATDDGSNANPAIVTVTTPSTGPPSSAGGSVGSDPSPEHAAAPIAITTAASTTIHLDRIVAPLRLRTERANHGGTVPASHGGYAGAAVPKSDHTQWRDLYDEVVTTGLCTGCTACIVACPFNVLGYEDDLPVQLQDEGPDRCSHGDRGCSLCTLACPRFREWESEIDDVLFGGTRRLEELIGRYRDIWLARATSPDALMAGQDGGVVTALLAWGLDTGRIDGALTSALSDDRPWGAEPTVVTDLEGVVATAGSRYTYSANPLGLLKAAELGLSRVALVGMGCQASVTGSMEARRVNKWRRKIAWTFGLLCSKSFTYDGLIVEIAQRELGIDLDRLIRVNVKGKLLFYTDDGEEHTYPLKQAHRFTRPGCLRCPDFAAEHADVSFGGLGQSEGWTLSIVRTERGQGLWDAAIADGVIETRPATDDPAAVDLMFRLAARSRERWPSPDELPSAGRTPGLVG